MNFSLNLAIPNKQGYITYHMKSDDETLRDIYRFIRDYLNIPIKHFYLSCNINLSLKSFDTKITDVLHNGAIVHICHRLLAGPKRYDTEELQIYVQLPHRQDIFTIHMNPNDIIYTVINEIVEILDQKEIFDLTPKDLELVDGNQILNPYDELAIYPQLSRTYLHYIVHEEVQSGILKTLGSDAHYYGYEIFGKQIIPVPRLELRLKTQDMEKRKHKCPICFGDTQIRNPVTLPNCRHIFCKGCLDEYVKRSNILCPICRQKI